MLYWMVWLETEVLVCMCFFLAYTCIFRSSVWQRPLPIRHGCNYNPQQLDKICLLWFHISWIISSLFIFISIMFVYTFHTFHCLLHCLGIIVILYSLPLFWFCLSTHFLWHHYVPDITPNSHDGYNWKFLTSMASLL